MTARTVLLIVTLLHLAWWQPPAPGKPSVPADLKGALDTSVLASDRKVDWSTAGATIVNRSSVCTTVSAYNGSTAAINTAITNCSSGGGGVVSLGAGTFGMTSGAVCLKSNVTLRGQGAASTKLDFSGGGGSCNGAFNTVIEFAGTSLYLGGSTSGFTTANWTAGYTKGTTVITLSSVSGLSTGLILGLDQADDSTTRVDGIWNNSAAGSGSIEGPGATWFRTATRNQIQYTRVTNVAGSNVTISPPVDMPNWASGKSPGAIWKSSQPLSSAGLENLTVDFGDSSVDRVVRFENAYSNWIKGVRLVGGVEYTRTALLDFGYGSVNNTLRDSYIFGVKQLTGGSSTLNYGLNNTGASRTLIENTIWHQVAFPWIQGVASAGSVFGYNYSYSNWYTPCGTLPTPCDPWPTDCGINVNCIWMQPSNRYHGTANNYTLYESNDSNGSATDALHGPSFFGTMFRNHLEGWELEGGANTGAGKQQQTTPANLYALTRYMNYIGNVMGRSGVHSAYQCATATNTDSCGTYGAVIWTLGYSGNGANTAPVNNDGQVKTTLFRWGNYDNVTGAARWCGNSSNTGWSTTCSSTSEVPTAEASYPNAVPSTETVPLSLYYAAKPSWYGSVTWPSIGPDVSGVTGAGNKVIKIPARLCFESLSVDSAYGTQNVLSFTSGSGACPSIF